MLTAKYSKAFEEKSKEEKNKKAKMEVSESDYERCPGNGEIDAANEEIDAQIETDVSSSDDAAYSLNDSNGLLQAGNADDIKLAVAFVSMVIVATAVSVLGKLVVSFSLVTLPKMSRSISPCGRPSIDISRWLLVVFLCQSSEQFSNSSVSCFFILYCSGDSFVQLSQFPEFVQPSGIYHFMLCLYNSRFQVWNIHHRRADTSSQTDLCPFWIARHAIYQHVST
jgi:hypothetical protein